MGRISKTVYVVVGYFISVILLFLLLMLIVHTENSFLISQVDRGNLTSIMEMLASVAIFFEYLYILAAILIFGFFVGYIINRKSRDKEIVRGFQITNIFNALLILFLIVLYIKDKI